MSVEQVCALYEELSETRPLCGTGRLNNKLDKTMAALLEYIVCLGQEGDGK